MPDCPTISAIVPTKNRPESLLRLIESLCKQQYPADKLEILIVDDGSSPACDLCQFSRETNEKHNIKIIRHQSSVGAQKSRNEGLQAANGNIALMLDDDIELVNGDFIARAVAVFNDNPQVAAVACKKYDTIKNSAGQITSREYSTSRATLYSGELLADNRVSEGFIEWGPQVFFVKRELLVAMGGYDGIYGLNGGHSFREESDVHARLRKQGYRIWYLPEIAIRHHVIATGGHGANIGKRLYWIAHNHIIFLRRHIRFWPLRALGYLFDIARYSWVQGRFRYIFSMLRGYLAGWRNAFRDRGPNNNPWLNQL